MNARNPETGSTPLLQAALKGHSEVVALLAAAGADVNVRDKSGATPIGEALRYRHTAVVEELLKRGAKQSGADANSARGSDEGPSRYRGAVREARRGHPAEDCARVHAAARCCLEGTHSDRHATVGSWRM